METKVQSQTSDIDSWLAHVRDGGCLPEKSMRIMCAKAIEILAEEPNVVPVGAPVTISGDIRGKFHDLVKLFQISGEVPETRYVFLGGYVNRGYRSVETFTLLLLLKLKYPGCLTLLRGNHEAKDISQFYGLYDEVSKKYGNTCVWKFFTEVFQYLPIAAVVDGNIFCVHAGVSPLAVTLDQINSLERVVKDDLPQEGALYDMLWSRIEDDIEGWAPSPIGAGWLIGSRIITNFTRLNRLELVARGHRPGLLTGY